MYFLVLFMSLTVLFQLIFTFIYSTLKKKKKKHEMHVPKIVVRVFISEKLSTTQRIILNWDIERAFAK